MSVLERPVTRRAVVTAGAAASMAWLVRSRRGRAHGQVLQADIIAAPVAQLPVSPSDSAWLKALPATITMHPQNIVVPRVTEAGAKSIQVRVLYDAERVGFLVEWLDAHKDADLSTVAQFRDGVAIQFPEDPQGQPPSFMMGEAGRGVTIYHWKSDWQFARLVDVEEAHPNMVGDHYQYSGAPEGKIPEATDYLTKGRKEYLTAAAVGNTLADPLAQEKIGPVQKMRAEGFGTLEPTDHQDARGLGEWVNGGWKVLISVPRQQAKFTFAEGQAVPVAFAVWDGSRQERNGMKAYSLWSPVGLRTAPSAVARPGGDDWLVPGFTAFWGVLIAGLTGLLAFQFWKERKSKQTSPPKRPDAH
ncbi:MAG: hypothetical protein FJ039_06065 [Chloroflexi bacterium]|nr:hypothetical protein [Chloroflexota bacterium]